MQYAYLAEETQKKNMNKSENLFQLPRLLQCMAKSEKEKEKKLDYRQQ